MAEPKIDIIALGLLSDGVNDWRNKWAVNHPTDDTYLLEIMRLILAGDTKRLHEIGQRALAEERYVGHPSDQSKQ